jgi:sulfate transport system ATP-binding protein
VSIEVRNITKKFGDFLALDNVSVEIPTGSLMALLGPSGSGKTTLLRVIAGLEVADRGSVFCQDEDVTRSKARERNVGFVFQHYALFRHMNVFENVAFGLRIRKENKVRTAQRVRELLRLVRMEGLERRYPAQLSGGQRQRIALARALAIRPRVLLLDEPFGALDAKVRQELRAWLRELHEEIHMTSVFVTHDQEEAFAVADRVVVMNHGKVEQVGAPQDVFEHPANPFVMDFLGNVNAFEGRVENGRAIVGGIELECPPEATHVEGSKATVYVRPHELEIQPFGNGEAALEAQVERVLLAGSVAKISLVAAEFGFGINVDLSLDRYHELGLKRGDTVYVSPRKVRVFPSHAGV